MEKKSYFIYLELDSSFLGQNRIDDLFRQFAELGKTTIIPHSSSVPTLEEFDTQRLYLHWSIKLITEQPEENIEKILLPLQQNKDNKVKWELISPPGRQEKDKKQEILQVTPEDNKPLKQIQPNVQKSSHPFVFRSGNNIFGIEQNYICDIIESKENNQQVMWKSNEIPILPLHKLFHYRLATEKKSFLIIEHADKNYSLIMDQQIEYQEKEKLDACFDYVPFIREVLLINDIGFAFILDLSRIINYCDLR